MITPNIFKNKEKLGYYSLFCEKCVSLRVEIVEVLAMRIMLSIIMLLAVAADLSAEEPFNGLVTHPDGRGVKARISVLGRSKQT